MLFDAVVQRACYYALWLQNKYEALLELYAVPCIFSSAMDSSSSFENSKSDISGCWHIGYENVRWI